MTLSQNIKRRRQEVHMTLEEVAKIVGVSRRTNCFPVRRRSATSSTESSLSVSSIINSFSIFSLSLSRIT